MIHWSCLLSFAGIDHLQQLAGSQKLNTTGQTNNRDDFYTKSLMTPSIKPITKDIMEKFFNYLWTSNTNTNWFGAFDTVAASLPSEWRADVTTLFYVQFNGMFMEDNTLKSTIFNRNRKVRSLRGVNSWVVRCTLARQLTVNLTINPDSISSMGEFLYFSFSLFTSSPPSSLRYSPSRSSSILLKWTMVLM